MCAYYRAVHTRNIQSVFILGFQVWEGIKNFGGYLMVADEIVYSTNIWMPESLINLEGLGFWEEFPLLALKKSLHTIYKICIILCQELIIEESVQRNTGPLQMIA